MTRWLPGQADIERLLKAGELQTVAPNVPVLYAGPLRGMPHQLGVPPQFWFIRRYCGSLVADDSYAVIAGPRQSGALQGVLVFLNRHDHALLYYGYP